MPKEKFVPTPEQLALIRRAEELAEEVNATGHHAPPELVRRMTEEGRLLVADYGPEGEASSVLCGVAQLPDLDG